MNKLLAIAFLAGIVAVLAAGTSQAHHSYGDFDPCKSVSVRGEIARLSWVNPHVLITVRDAGAVEHRVVWLSLSQAARAGMSENPLREGDEVVVTGTPHRDPAQHVMSRMTVVERPSDGWKWAAERSTPLPSSCSDAPPVAAASQ